MTSSDDTRRFLAKATESLATAQSEVANQRYNSCANRCYYACFQAAVAALLRAGVRSPRPDGRWSHAFVQAQFAGLIARRKQYPAPLRDALVRLLALRESADYTTDQISQTQALRAVRRAQEFVTAVQRGGERQ
jgi:uncharacterized protein (UPF0332 family)